jgi:signal transduction histidine kinase/heme-degrading monooxygenase HmoA
MVLAISRFRVANGLESEVREAFGRRPRLVESAPGFLGMETFTDAADAAVFYLVTRWTDSAAFESWHRGEAHEQSHRGVPRGLRLDPDWTKVTVMGRLGFADDDATLEPLIADSLLVLSAFLRTSTAICCVRAATNGTIRAVNGAFAERLGHEPGNLVGAPIRDHLGTNDEALLQSVLAKGPSARGERFLLNFYDARREPFTLDCVVDPTPQGFTLLGEPRSFGRRAVEEALFEMNAEWAVIARERAQLAARAKAATASAEAQNRAKDLLLATVSHDLRNPLNAIAGAAKLLRVAQADAKTGRWLDVIERSVALQQRLIDDLLDLGRIAFGTMELRSSSVGLRSVVELAIESSLQEIGRKKLELTTALQDVPEVWGDRERLQQLVDNLVGNAVKFTPEHGRVSIRLERAGGHVRLEVRDTGSGIAPELLPHVFEPFRQGSSAAKASGMGLGLTIAKHVVELHGGTISAGSEGADLGATFVVSLPAHGRTESGS